MDGFSTVVVEGAGADWCHTLVLPELVMPNTLASNPAASAGSPRRAAQKVQKTNPIARARSARPKATT
eukprot:18392-Amphidinium_carterae.1